MQPLNRFLSSNRRLSKIDIKNLKRYLFLDSFEWDKSDNDFAPIIPVSVVVSEITSWLDYTHYEYLVLYKSLDIYKHTKYTFNDFLTMNFVEIHKIVESCKFIIEVEKRIKKQMELEEDEENLL